MTKRPLSNDGVVVDDDDDADGSGAITQADETVLTIAPIATAQPKEQEEQQQQQTHAVAPPPRAFYEPFNTTSPFALAQLEKNPHSLTRDMVATMRTHYIGILATGGLDDNDESSQRVVYEQVVAHFPLYFSNALRTEALYVRVLDLNWTHFSVPMVAHAQSGTVGTWSSYLTRTDTLIGVARRLVQWLGDRGIATQVVPHASQFHHTLSCIAAEAWTPQQGVVTPSISAPDLGHWIPINLLHAEEPVGILFAQTFK